MADTALQNAERRHDEIAAEINALQSRLDEKRKELERVKSFIDDYKLYQSFPWDSPSLPLTPPPAPATMKFTNPPRELVGRVVETILRQSGRPMPRDELYANVVHGKGLKIRGKDPVMVFSTMLWRMQDRFIRLPGKGYWLVHEDCPAVGYVAPPQLEPDFGP